MTQDVRDLIAEAQAALPDDARMDGYYIGFDRTGVAVIDAVLSAVAIAGKGAHHTEAWGDDGDGYYDGWPGLPSNPSGWNEALKDDGGSAVSLIQLAANRSAELVRRLVDALEVSLGERDAAVAAKAWDEGVTTALNYAKRQPDGITLKLETFDGDEWQNPYRKAVQS